MISPIKHWLSNATLAMVALAVSSSALSQQTAHDLVNRMLDAL